MTFDCLAKGKIGVARVVEILIHPEIVALSNSKPAHWSSSLITDLPILVMSRLSGSSLPSSVSSCSIPHSIALIPILLNV
jgi:hypothetical protein